MTTPERDQARDANGGFIQTVEGAERDAQACLYRSRGWSLQRISDELGYGSASNVRRAILAVKDAVIRPAGVELVAQELAQLDYLRDKAMEVLERHHIRVDHGRVVTTGEGEDKQPLLDDGPILQAINTIAKLDESRRKLLGLDAAQKVDATVHEVTQEDLALSELIREKRARDAQELAELAAEL